MPNKSIRITEQNISNILFKLCLFITLIALGMMLVGFFTRGRFPPTKISTFYIGVLLIYSVHKEALRWIEVKGSQPQQRRGEYFVYAWIIITVILYLLNFFTKGHFTRTPQGIELSALSEITFTTLEVCGVFILTRISKIVTFRFFKRQGKR